MSNMYDNTKTWNPFKGCQFDCVYCIPSFQRQSKRWGKNNCWACYHFVPHFHPERLDRIPSADIIFVAGSGDISFCPTEQVMLIINAIKEHNKRCPGKIYYFQSKIPATFERFKNELPDNCYLLTTLETDMIYFTDGSKYMDYTAAGNPLIRMFDFQSINYPRKIVTIEPVMEFSKEFARKIIAINPEYVWIGFNTQSGQIRLPEPSLDDVESLIEQLKDAGIEVKGKDLRGLEI